MGYYLVLLSSMYCGVKININALYHRNDLFACEVAFVISILIGRKFSKRLQLFESSNKNICDDGA